MVSVRGAHLVGSLTYPDAESAMTAAAGQLGALLRRIPDGEPGDRFHWIMFQPGVLAEADGIERVGDHPIMIAHLDGIEEAPAQAHSYWIATVQGQTRQVDRPGKNVEFALKTLENELDLTRKKIRHLQIAAAVMGAAGLLGWLVAVLR